MPKLESGKETDSSLNIANSNQIQGGKIRGIGRSVNFIRPIHNLNFERDIMNTHTK